MKSQSRRQFIKDSALVTAAALIMPPLSSLGANLQSVPGASTPIFEAAIADMLALDASVRPPAPQTGGFHMGTATDPGGHTIKLDSRSLLLDGKPWVLISGEFHFSRCPEAEWHDELLKIKAGGVSMVTTYIFWIHHEETEGKWDWTGQRNLQKFVKTCQEVGLYVLLRIGPWCHGEVLNGGFPNWLQKKGDDKVFELRRDNLGYLAYVTKFYEQIYQQSQGLFWKDGGPIIATQLENEYGGPAQHLMTLKKIARDRGMDVPLYTCTGWGGGGAAPFGEMVPFSGAYAEGFWDRSLEKISAGYAGSLRFSGPRRSSAEAMGALGAAPATNTPQPASTGTYPSFTCELGGGMMPSYHRRILIYPEDTESLVLAKLGSGANLLGIYMYHGGANPEGKLSYLNETQATGYWNDLPVKDYDFQAPIGKLGQEREQYHWLRLLGLFMKDFGPGLSAMTARMPITRGALNWAVRSDGDSGYIFVSHYQRLSQQPNQENIQFKVKFANGDVVMPSQPVTITDNSRFFWPVNLDLSGIKLISASAQPIAQIAEGAVRFTVFKQTAAIAAEFVFDRATGAVQSSTGKITNESSKIYVRNVQPGLGAAIRLEGKDKKIHIIILLSETMALDFWKGEWHGRERLFIAHGYLLLDGPQLRLRNERPEDCSVAIFPAPANLSDGHNEVPVKQDGLFRRFSPRINPTGQVKAVIEQIKTAGPPRKIPIAPSVPSRKQGMAMQPEDIDFANAGIWHVKLPDGIDANRDLRLRVRYTGDVARAYLGDKLIDDDFYNSRPFEISLRRYGPLLYKEGLVLKILPLSEDAPIYFTDRSKLKFNGHIAIALEGVDVIETHDIRLEVKS